MQRLLTLQSEYKTLLLAADAFKNLEGPDLVIGDEEYERLMKRLDETCKNVRYKGDIWRRREFGWGLYTVLMSVDEDGARGAGKGGVE